MNAGLYSFLFGNGNTGPVGLEFGVFRFLKNRGWGAVEQRVFDRSDRVI
jgi:hypothetical protein